jgi:hypothetical protein
VHSWLNTSEVVERMIRTLGEVFDKVWIINVSRSNLLLVATDGRGDLFEAINEIPPALHALAERIRVRSHRLTDLPEVALITDDRPLSAVIFDQAAIKRWSVIH